MDKFQKAQQANAQALAQAQKEQALAAQTEPDWRSAEREAERQQNIAKNLGNA